MGVVNVTKRYFVTGTDTEVGKTVASCACAGRNAVRLSNRRL